MTKVDNIVDVEPIEPDTPAVRAAKLAGYGIFVIVLSLTTFKAGSLYKELAVNHFAPATEYTAARTSN